MTNISVGKGRIYFKREGDTQYRELGETETSSKFTVTGKLTDIRVVRPGLMDSVSVLALR